MWRHFPFPINIAAAINFHCETKVLYIIQEYTECVFKPIIEITLFGPTQTFLV